MQAQAHDFTRAATNALANSTLKRAIDRTTINAETKRGAVVGRFAEFAAARERGRAIKDHVIAHLDHYLDMFEHNAIASGAKVHWARDADEACGIVIDICKTAGARSVTRSKSMLGEEIGLPHALAAAGIERVETDLAEHIIQLAGDRPSHIIWPALHRTREQVSDLFNAAHATRPASSSTSDLVRSARGALRVKFMAADIGISGANFLLADSGAVCTVTNEGNAELTTTPPRVHIVTAGIEKLVPGLPHAMSLLRLLSRSATGSEFAQYTTFHCGPKRAGDADGPEEFHIVLVDNGRTKMLREGLAEMLRCIRCGACMNHCVVFRQIGGHAYGATYPGPMGAVLTPVLSGLSENRDLPQACTLNGKCQEVCPVAIPLPSLLRGWRDRSWREGLVPPKARLGVSVWRFISVHPALFRLVTFSAVRFLRLFARRGWIGSLPLATAWTDYRDFPKPAKSTFLDMLAKGKRPA